MPPFLPPGQFCSVLRGYFIIRRCVLSSFCAALISSSYFVLFFLLCYQFFLSVIFLFSPKLGSSYGTRGEFIGRSKAARLYISFSLHFLITRPEVKCATFVSFCFRLVTFNGVFIFLLLRYCARKIFLCPKFPRGSWQISGLSLQFFFFCQSRPVGVFFPA